MNILLLGSGGREHAIAWKIAQSPKVDQLFIAPGNAGTALVGTNVNIKADDFPAIKEFALANHIDMVVVGPEDPLVKGVYDYFKSDAALALLHSFFHCIDRNAFRCAYPHSVFSEKTRGILFSY